MSNSTVTPIDGRQYFGVTNGQAKSQLNMQQFLQLLTVQLANQNPLEPMNDRDFFAQMAQLGQVQGMDGLQKSADVQQAQSLMGKTVSAVRPMTEGSSGQAQLITGVVKTLAIKNGAYYIGIQEANGGVAEVKMSTLQSVQETADVTTASNLIGKKVDGLSTQTVDGKDAAIEVTGTVIGITNDNGRLLAQVKMSNGKVVPVATGDITHVIAS